MPLNLGTIVLQGRDVTLRPLDVSDAEALALAAGESRETYQYNPVPDGIDGARAYIARALAIRDAGERYPFAIEWRGRAAGSTSYFGYQPWQWKAGSKHQRVDRPDVVEIGFTWLAQSAQRTRCNTECKYLLLRHAFETWQVHAVKLRTDVRNARSRAAIERLGATFDGVLRADKPGEDDTVRDSAFYSIVNGEWEEVRRRLEEKLRRET